MSKFNRSISLVGVNDGKPEWHHGLFFAKTGCYSMYGYNSRHYWFMFFRIFGVRYSVEW